MAPDTIGAPLVVIVGPTASGKTALAIDLAERFNGEIICADSRTVYKEMDIGTAKPTKEETRRVPHWGIDLVFPNERFNAAKFQSYAVAKIADIRARGKVPFLVGGTGLYVDAVLFQYTFGNSVNETWRHDLSSLSIQELHEYCRKNNITLPENTLNKRYVVRAIEQGGVNQGRIKTPLANSIIVGITTSKDILETRIVQRTEHMFENDVVKEARMLGKKYGWESEAMTSSVYRICKKYIDNRITLEEAKLQNIVADKQLAKRQRTWFRRNKYIEWTELENASRIVESQLRSTQQ